MTDTPTPTVDSTEIVPLFPTLIWKMQLAKDAYEPINENITARLRALAAGTPGLPPGGKLQTDQTLHQLPEFQALAEIIHGASTGVLDFLKIVYDGIAITGCWANISPPGTAHGRHSHPNNFLSGVYYVSAPTGGEVITFYDPRPQPPISVSTKPILTTTRVCISLA